jgi:hypothetical protein
MKLPYKTALIIIGAVIFTSFLFSLTSEATILAFIGYYGLFGCGAGLLAFVTAVVISIATKSKEAYVQGIVLGGGILLLTGIFALVYTFSHIEFSR